MSKRCTSNNSQLFLLYDQKPICMEKVLTSIFLNESHENSLKDVSINVITFGSESKQTFADDSPLNNFCVTFTLIGKKERKKEKKK
jgi:hypothetical protein